MSTSTGNENIMAYLAFGFNQEDAIVLNMNVLHLAQFIPTPTYGQFFAEVPDDAFNYFGLDFGLGVPDLPQLHQSYIANCPRCFIYTTTPDPTNRFVQCDDCMEFAATTMQRIYRGHVIRRKMNRLKKSELMHRWLTGCGVNGSDLSWNIMKYV